MLNCNKKKKKKENAKNKRHWKKGNVTGISSKYKLLVLSSLMKLAHLPTVRNITCGSPVRISRDRDCLRCHRLDT